MAQAERFVGDFSNTDAVQQAAELLTAGAALAVDNDTVCAIWGEGANPSFAGNVDTAKGREPGRAYGATFDTEDFLGLVDMDRIAKDARPLLTDSDSFKPLEAMAFIKVPARQVTIEDRGLPESMLSRTADGLPVVQNWSPRGKANITKLLALAGLQCPAVTSLNASKQPEITDFDKARKFAAARGLPIMGDRRALRKANGSFPIIAIDSQAIRIVRARPKSIGYTWLTRLLDGFPLHYTVSEQVNAGIDSKELESLRGRDLHDAALSWLGWAAIDTSCPDGRTITK